MTLILNTPEEDSEWWHWRTILIDCKNNDQTNFFFEVNHQTNFNL